MELGINGGAKLFEGLANEAGTGKQNRMMFLTDAQPNSGSTSPDSLMGICKANAETRKIYTSFFGLGVDFGVELVEAISHIPACNYFTVQSPKEFKQLMDRDFDYIVTPSCFNVQVKIASSSTIEAERVYGSPGHEIPQQGVLLEILSTFPSPKENDDQTKGGIVLIKLKKPQQQAGEAELKVVVSYDDADGKHYSDENTIVVSLAAASPKGYYSGSAIRKAIALARFVNIMKWWIRDTSSGKSDASSASVSQAAGVPVPPVDPLEGNSWTPLAVSKHYKAAFAEFLSHYERELEALADAEGGEESEDHQHLAEHTQKLLGLINNVSAEEIDECMHAVLTDEEVESGSVDSQELRKRVEVALGTGTRAVDLADKQYCFDQEVKRRIKEILVRKLTAAVTAEGENNLRADQSKREALAERVAGFALARKDSAGKEQWQRIALSELEKLLPTVQQPKKGLIDQLKGWF